MFTLIGLLTSWAITAQWSDDPLVNNQLTQERESIYLFDHGVTKDGLSYIVFNRLVNENIATFLQIVDREGVKLFPGDGKLISNEETWTFLLVGQLLFVDKDGNALLPVADCKNSDAEGLSYRVYKVSPAGEHLWSPEGVTLGSPIADGFESKMNIIQLEDSSYVFTYIREENSNLPKIQLKHVSKNGELLESRELQENGVRYDYPYLANTGYGQFALVYIRAGVLLAQKFDFDLTSIWTQPVRIYAGGFPGVPLQNVISVHPDPQGGVFVAWHDDRDGNNVESVHIAHVKENGDLGFTGNTGGEKVSYANYRGLRPQIAYNEKNDCLYAIWYEINSGQTYQRLVIQKIARSGELLWETEGLLIQETNREEIIHYSIHSEEDQVAVFYLIQHGHADMSAFATLIDGTTGNFVWTDEKVEFSTNVSRKVKLFSSPLIAGSYWLTIWGDNRDGVSNDYPPLYMQKVNRDASLGGIPTAIRPLHKAETTFGVKPSYVKESTQFSFENPKAGTVDISIYTLSGQKAATVFHGKAAQGALRIPWVKPAALSSGIYIVRLTDAEGTMKTTRIIIHNL
ncbi:MAG: T9SS type A sorting domain-containing protein [Candidatus Symbiothrix sp.]|nr:T9SS type A sorting domain-containing protein [Candidatus Symbiothrix sp.]